MGMTAKRNTAAKLPGKQGPKRLTSRDGRLEFKLSRTSRGIYVERVEALGVSGSITHGMLVTKPGDFSIYLETDSARLEQPGLYRLVEREIEEMLDDGR